MSYKDLVPGANVPHDVNALIEISKGEGSVKYEFDRHSSTIVVDRLRESSMRYPLNYGCIPNTISDDGDPLDIIVICEPIQTGAVIAARPIGILMMNDEKGHDVKIIAVPADRLTTMYLDIQNVDDIPEMEKAKIEHFFSHYKDLDNHMGKWSETSGWQGVEVAHDYIRKAIEMGKADK